MTLKCLSLNAGLLSLAVAWACGSDPAPPPATASGGSAGAVEAGAAFGEGGLGGEAAAAGAAGAGGTTQTGAAGASAGHAGDSGPTHAGASAAGGSAGDSSYGGSQGQAGSTELGAGGGNTPNDTAPALSVLGGVYISDAPPNPFNAKALPKVIQLFGAAHATNGGTTILRVQLSAPLDPPRFVLLADVIDGYFTVTARDLDHDGIYEIELQVGTQITQPSVRVRVAPIDALGNVGNFEGVSYPITPSGVGDVKITLSYERTADLDLIVIEPGDFEISYQSPLSPSGGRFDLDSTSGCNQSALFSENIYWPTGSAPSGSYGVFVKKYDDCGNAPIDYTVTIFQGTEAQSFHGVFPWDDEGFPVLVTTFDR